MSLGLLVAIEKANKQTNTHTRFMFYKYRYDYVRVSLFIRMIYCLSIHISICLFVSHTLTCLSVRCDWVVVREPYGTHHSKHLLQYVRGDCKHVFSIYLYLFDCLSVTYIGETVCYTGFSSAGVAWSMDICIVT